MEEKKGKKRRKILYHRVAAAVLLLVLLIGGGYLLWKNLDYRRGAEDYQAAAEAAGVPQWIKPPERTDSSEQHTDPYAAALAAVDLDALRETNPDVIAWIMIPGTDLSYPVLQGEDNNWYLNHTWMGERSAVGAVFMECQCAPDFSDFNTILYGHRMNNESMFGILRSYQEESFFQEHPTVYLVTDSGVRIYDIFAAHEVGIREIVYRLDLEESGLQQEFIDFCLERSEIDTGVVPTAEDQILTLSTCTGRGHATRWVVQAVLRSETARQTA